MKLLYDQNLPPRLVTTLASEFPDSRHVSEVGLDRADDSDVWTFAQREGFTIVSKDADFMQMSFLIGAPPKVVWVRRGNCSTSEIEELLRSSSDNDSGVRGLERSHDSRDQVESPGGSANPDVESLQRHGVEVILIPDLGHFMMIEDPESFDAVLENVVENMLQ